MHRERNGWAEDVASLLAAMRETWAAAVRMCYFEQLSESEIAASTGMSVLEVRGALAGGLQVIGCALVPRQCG